MKISKSKALELIDKKKNQFSGILDRANYSNMHDQEYEEVYYDTESLLCDLFSKEESMEFRRNVGPAVIVSGRSESQRLQDYKKHLKSCISQLKVYRNRVQNFWNKQKVDNWSLSNNKLQILCRGFKISWKAIGFVLFLLALVAGAIDNWQTVSEFVNSTLT